MDKAQHVRKFFPRDTVWCESENLAQNKMMDTVEKTLEGQATVR